MIVVVTKDSIITRGTEIDWSSTDNRELRASRLLNDRKRDRLKIVATTRCASLLQQPLPRRTANIAVQADSLCPWRTCELVLLTTLRTGDVERHHSSRKAAIPARAMA